MDPQRWVVCPKCHGEGKQTRMPSRKSHLRHQKRAKTTTSTKLPMRLDPCTTCNQTGIIPSPYPAIMNILPDTPHVAIVGGGLGGLALGLALRHRGISFTIFERDANFAQRSQGYGLTMQQASKALASFGIPTLKEGIVSTKHVVHTPDGKVVGEWGWRKWGRDPAKKPPKRQNVHIARQALRRELWEALLSESEGNSTASILWGHKLVDMGMDANGTGVLLTFEVKNDSGVSKKVTKDADLVVGADGIRSTVRSQLLGETLLPLRYLDCLVVLGICALDILDNVSRASQLLDGETVFQTADGSTRIYLMPFSSTQCMWQLSFPLDGEQSAKLLSQKGPAALKAEAIRRCESWHSPIPKILQSTPVDLISGYPVYDRDLITLDALGGSSTDSGIAFPATLIGDAAHPMSPFKGQGANQALLDALSLARSLFGQFREGSSKSLDTAVRLYNEEMTSRSAAKVKASAKAAQFLHTDTAIQVGNITRGAASVSCANEL